MGELYEILYLDIGTIEMCENKNFLSQWRSVEGFGRETDNDIGRSIWLRGPSESTVDKPKLTRSNRLDLIDLPIHFSRVPLNAASSYKVQYNEMASVTVWLMRIQPWATQES